MCNTLLVTNTQLYKQKKFMWEEIKNYIWWIFSLCIHAWDHSTGLRCHEKSGGAWLHRGELQVHSDQRIHPGVKIQQK